MRGIEALNLYYNRLKSTFGYKNSKYERNPDNIIDVAKKIIIPATITFEGMLEEKTDVR